MNGSGIPWSIVAVTIVAVAILATLLRRSRKQANDLRRALDASSKELEHLQLSFSRFAPQEVVERIISGGVARYAERKEVTVLFADLVGFTQLSESLEPEILVGILDHYFSRMSRVISDHRGHVSKFIGDGILALFGALEHNPWKVNDAVQAALAMQTALREYNAVLLSQGVPELRVGIGIHHGVALAGIIGSNELMEFTVIGNTVNVAARVEHLTRTHGADVLVTEEIRALLDPRFRLRRLPATRVAGLSEALVVYAVDGFAPD